MDETDIAEFELSMLTMIHMLDKPYEEADKAARKEFKELREWDREINRG